MQLKKEAEHYLKDNEPVDDFLNWDTNEEQNEETQLIETNMTEKTVLKNNNIGDNIPNNFQKSMSSNQFMPLNNSTSLTSPNFCRQELRQQINFQEKSKVTSTANLLKQKVSKDSNLNNHLQHINTSKKNSQSLPLSSKNIKHNIKKFLFYYF